MYTFEIKFVLFIPPISLHLTYF